MDNDGALRTDAGRRYEPTRRCERVIDMLAGLALGVLLHKSLNSAAKLGIPQPVGLASPLSGSPAASTTPQRPPRGHAGTQVDGPDEGFYDPRRGASGYAPVVATFGALAVPALVVLFTTNAPIPADKLALSSGLLIIGIFGSLFGAFGLAAVGAERDGTANLGAVIMFIGVPAAISMFSVLGAFEVLAAFFVPTAAKAFLFTEGLGIIFGVYLVSIAIGDASTLHPRTKSPTEFDEWRAKQWLRNRKMSYKAAGTLSTTGLLVPAAVILLRIGGLTIHLTGVLVNVSIYVGVALCFLGAVASGQRTKHPVEGNEQVSLRRWEAWISVFAVSLFGAYLLLVLPIR
jgi:hypothetical protein